MSGNNPRDWRPPFDDDEEFWRKFDQSVRRFEAASSPRNTDAAGTQSSPDSERFVAPDPPPITPPADAIGRAAWGGVIVGPLVAIIGYAFGLNNWLGGAGLAAAIGGFVVLVARRDRHVPPGQDFGDGAVV